MSKLVSLFDLDLTEMILFAAPESGDNVRLFQRGDEVELVDFLKASPDYQITDPGKAYDVGFWERAATGRCNKLFEISIPKRKVGKKPKNRKARNRNRQKYSAFSQSPRLYAKTVCVGVCTDRDKACRPCSLGLGISSCHCA